jgi:hypothetical protein
MSRNRARPSCVDYVMATKTALALVLGAASCAATAATSVGPVEDSTDEPEPTEVSTPNVIDTMLSSYAGASSYLDHGTVTIELPTPAPQRVEITFATTFIRERGFRFAYSIDGAAGMPLPEQQLVVWSDFRRTYSRSSGAAGVMGDGGALARTLNAEAGASSLTSVLVPSLLLRDVQPGAKQWWRGASIAGVDQIDGREYWRVAATAGEQRLTAWIDRDAHVLRRIVKAGGTANAVVTIDYAPELDRSVDAALLQAPDGASEPMPVTVAPTPTTSHAEPMPLPDALNAHMIRAGVDIVKGTTHACGERATARGVVKVHVRVTGAGNVAGVDVRSAPEPVLGACVASALMQATFAPTLRGGAFVIPYEF